MIFRIKAEKDRFIDSLFPKIMAELNLFYGIKLERNVPRVFIVDDRKTIDALKGVKSERWVVGWAEHRNIYLLNKGKFETESSHQYSDSDYSKLLKHEIAHMFYRTITGTDKPRWLTEGLSLYLADQLEQRKKPAEFKNFLNYYDKSEAGVYAESGFVVKLLIDKFGKDLMIKYLKQLKISSEEGSVSKFFKEVFGVELSYSALNKLI